MLGQHSQIAFAGEFQWVFEHGGVKSPADMNEYYRSLEKDRFFQAHRPHLDRTLAFPALARSILSQMKSAADRMKPVVTVSMHRHYEALRRIWPNARFIHLTRDGRDVAASWIKFGWHGNTWSCANEWAARLDEWKTLRSCLADGRYFELRFEDLIDNPSVQLTRICHHFGLEYEGQMLQYHRHSTYAPITKSRIRQWSKKLTHREIQVFETIAIRHLIENGYSPSGAPPVNLTAAYLVGLRADDKIRRVRAKIREFGVKLWALELIARRTRLDSLHALTLKRMHQITNSKLE